MTRTTHADHRKATLAVLALAAFTACLTASARATDRPPVFHEAPADVSPEVVDIDVLDASVVRLEAMMHALEALTAAQAVTDVAHVLDTDSIAQEIADLEERRRAWHDAAFEMPQPTPDGNPMPEPAPAGAPVETDMPEPVIFDQLPDQDADGSSFCPVEPTAERRERSRRLALRLRSLSSSLERIKASAATREIIRPQAGGDARLWEEAKRVQTDLLAIAGQLSEIEVQVDAVADLIAIYFEIAGTESRVKIHTGELFDVIDALQVKYDGLWRENEVAFAVASEIGILADEMQNAELAVEAKRLGHDSTANRRRMTHGLSALGSLFDQVQMLEEKLGGEARSR